MAFQFGIIITIGAYIGMYFDNKQGMEKPIFTALCSLFAVIIGIYYFVKDILKQ